MGDLPLVDYRLAPAGAPPRRLEWISSMSASVRGRSSPQRRARNSNQSLGIGPAKGQRASSSLAVRQRG